MKARQSLVIAVFVATTLASFASAQDAVVVESRVLEPGQLACTVGVFISNSVPLTGFVIQLEIRTKTGGAYFVGPIGSSFFQVRSGGRVDLSPLGSADPGGLWPAASRTSRRFAAPAANTCSGPISQTWATRVAAVDGISPDAIEYGTVSQGEPGIDSIALPPGSDPNHRDSASFYFVFDANGSPGCFEIDTCCTTPSNHIAFVSWDENGSYLIVPSFTMGVICLEGEPVNQPPVLDCPASVSAPAYYTDPGTTVTFSVSYSDEDTTLLPVCDPPSGSFFPMGSTDVTCIVTDTFGLADTCVFPVIVYDTGAPPSNQPPVIQCPAHPYVTVAPGDTGAFVNYNVSWTDEDTNLTPVCDPPPGSFFPLGTTIITCTIQDTFGLADTCSFPLSVTDVQQSSIVIESRTFLPGQTGCQVGVFLANHAPINGLVIPLEIRSMSGGAYLATPSGVDVFTDPPGGRLYNSPLGAADLGGAWPAGNVTRRKYATQVPATFGCTSGDDGQGWQTASATLDGSPDAVMHSTVSSGDHNMGDLIALPPGQDPPFTANASLLFTFDVNTSEGCFTIDTTCILPSGHIVLVDAVDIAPVDFTFTSATICINDCICESRGNPAVSSDPDINLLDVIYVMNVAFRGQPGIPDLHPACPVDATDLNCDGVCDIIDAVGIVDVAFRGADPATVICDPCQ